MNRSATRRAGFTLIELMLVLGILVMLGTVSVVAYSSIKTSANQKTAKVLVDQVVGAVERYQVAMGEFPLDDQGLEALITLPDDEKMAEKWKADGGPFLKDGKIPEDPWGMPLKYVKVDTSAAGTTTGAQFHVYSFGPNKTDDNGSGDDIPAFAQTAG